jgi:hypothetical protein
LPQRGQFLPFGQRTPSKYFRAASSVEKRVITVISVRSEPAELFVFMLQE